MCRHGRCAVDAPALGGRMTQGCIWGPAQGGSVYCANGILGIRPSSHVQHRLDTYIIVWVSTMAFQCGHGDVHACTLGLVKRGVESHAVGRTGMGLGSGWQWSLGLQVFAICVPQDSMDCLRGDSLSV